VAQQNILLLTMDQLRWDTLSCYGAPVCRTPHLDRLASQGVRFTQAITNTSICTPARASLLTGYAPFRHGLLANFERNVGYPWEIPDHNRLLPWYLQPAGYVCGNVGKWHVGVERGPGFYGFEGEHIAGWAPDYEHPDYLAYLEERGLPRSSVRDEVRGTFPNGKPSLPMMGVHEAPVAATYPHYLAQRTIEALHRYAERRERTGAPFFLACHFFGPHLPYFLPREVLERYDPGLVERHPSMAETFAGKPAVHRRYNEHWAVDSYPWPVWQRVVAAYWGYTSLIDEQIGRILGELERLGLADDTAVFFSADHGAFVGNHRLADKGPMMYDDTYRINLIARWPGVTPQGAVCDAPVTLVDLMPTCLEVAGVPVPEHLDARSLAPLLRDPQAEWSDAAFAEFHGHHFPYPQRMIRTRTHKLVVNPPDVNELYDLEADPYELNNVYGHPAYRDIQRELMSRLYQHLRQAGDNFHHWLPSMFEVETGDDLWARRVAPREH
jgi:arylsulfatase A-like enzyme